MHKWVCTRVSSVLDTVYLIIWNLVAPQESRMSLVFSRLSEIFGHLPHLNVLDMSDFMEHIGGMRFIRGDTPEMHECFWISIPNSVTHIISKTLTPLSINFQDKEKLEQFITKHSNLQTWCIHSYTEDDDNLFAHLLKPCRNIGISFGTSNWESECPKDLIPHWTFPEANYIASQVLVYPEFWTEETQRNKLESISIGDPSRKELSMIFMGAPQSFHCQLRNFLLGYYTSWTLECSVSEGRIPQERNAFSSTGGDHLPFIHTVVIHQSVSS